MSHETSIGWRSSYHPNVRVEREKRSASLRRFLLHRCDSSGATLGVTWLKPSNTETGKSNRGTYAGQCTKRYTPYARNFSLSTRTPGDETDPLVPISCSVTCFRKRNQWRPPHPRWGASKPANQQTSNKANKILRLLGNFTLGLKYCIL